MALRLIPTVLLAWTVSTPASHAAPVPADELRGLLAGNSTQGVIVIESPLLNHEFRRYFAVDGRLVSQNVTKGETDAGTWRVTPSGAICMKHENWAQGREYCTLVERSDGGYQRVFKGKPSEDMKVLPGDAFGLSR